MLPAACIVLETAPSVSWVCPLVPLFSPLVHLSAIPDSEPGEAALRTLVQEGRLLALSPALPPPAHRRLEHLIQVLNGSDAVHSGERLKALIVQHLGTDRDRAEGTSLGQELRAGESGMDPFWHERLQLALAERVERDQEEVASTLARIGRRHQQLLSALDGEEGAQKPPALPRQQVATAGLGLQLRRLRAWCRLLSGVGPLRPDMWYITRQQDCGEVILERYRQLSGHRELCAPELLVPGCASAVAEDWATPRLARFPGLLAAFSRLQTAVLASSGSSGADLREAMTLFSEHAPAWNAMIRKSPTAASAPLCRLQLSVLPGISWPKLLQRLDTSLPVEEGVADVEPAFCLFGLLQDEATIRP